MCGYDAPYTVGWDCHGLPIELEVSRLHPKQNTKERIASCRQYAQNTIDNNTKTIERMGIVIDQSYSTMHPKTEAHTIRLLAQLIEKKLIYESKKPVYWCISCTEALANAETVYHETSTTAIDVKFSFSDTCALIIWTTTPWTIFDNVAVAINPDQTYAYVQTGSEIWVIAEDSVEKCMQKYQITMYRISQLQHGKEIIGKYVRHPLLEKNVPIIAAHSIDSAGTGVMHVAPAYGDEDYELGVKNHLTMIQSVDEYGFFCKGVLQGKPVLDEQTTRHIIDLLQKHQKLVHAQTHQHRYPYCWRHKKQKLISIATRQWFLDLQKLPESIHRINFFPKWGKSTLTLMTKNRTHWCISRQRVWGTPIPLFIHKKDRTLHPRHQEILEHVIEEIEKKGIEAWQDIQLPTEEAHLYHKSTHTLDIWLDSGMTHTTTATQFPADVIVEGVDQYRGWFQSMVTTAHALYNKPPVRDLISHGRARKKNV